MMPSIYLDYAATTPVDPRVIAAMTQCLGLEGAFGNPASSHHYGQQAAQKIEHAREQVAAFINAEPREIIWTSGATEANNLAIKGIANFYQNRGKHIITMQTEHKAVLDVCAFLKKQGFDITALSPEADGLLNLEHLKQALRPDTILVSIMYVNNETGVLQPMQEIAEMVKANNTFLHVDAAQALGKLPMDVKTLPVDLLSFSGHKIYGPKGVGALYVRHRPAVRLQPLIHGGGQEQGLRSGTLATHQIVGMGEACKILREDMTQEIKYIQNLKETFLKKLQKNLHIKQVTKSTTEILRVGPTACALPRDVRTMDGKECKGKDACSRGTHTLSARGESEISDLRIHVNGNYQHSVCHILNLYFPNIESDILMNALPELAMSSGSACTSLEVQPSHVLQAMGLSDEWAHRSLRFSFGRFTTLDDIDTAIELLRRILFQRVNFV